MGELRKSIAPRAQMARTRAIAIAGAHNIILRGSLRGAIVVLPISLEPVIFSWSCARPSQKCRRQYASTRSQITLTQPVGKIYRFSNGQRIFSEQGFTENALMNG